MKEALLYSKRAGNVVECSLCCHRCVIKEKEFGFCGVRQNQGGTLYSHVYGKLVAANIDPIEKKPMYHFLPGSKSFSVATVGCNFRCGFCQNWELSQESAREGELATEEVPADEVARAALAAGCASVSYTYSEPTIFFEYALDIAREASAKGLRNVFVTNGYMTRDALEMIRPYLDAANVDLKFGDDGSYRRNCAGTMQPVLDSIRWMHEAGVWVEVTTLVVPGENDAPDHLAHIASAISRISKDIPWHVSRFHPDYKFEEKEPTPEKTLKEAARIGSSAGLRYVYAGNVEGWGNDTACPSCGKQLIRRRVFSIIENKVDKGACGFCGKKVAGVFQKGGK